MESRALPPFAMVDAHAKLHEAYFLQHFTPLNYEILIENNVMLLKNVNDFNGEISQKKLKLNNMTS